MKSNILIFALLLAYYSVINATNGNSASLKTKSINAIESSKDFVSESNCIYLHLDSLKVGDPFTDRDKSYGYYRMLFTSSEEMSSYFIEKIAITGDGKIKLVKRFKLTSEIVGSIFSTASFIRWIDAENIELIINDQTIYLDLTNRKAKGAHAQSH